MPKGKKIEPLDLEELENNPSLNGMLGHLETPPAAAIVTPTSPIGEKPSGASPAATSPKRHRMAEEVLDEDPEAGSTRAQAHPERQELPPIDLAPTLSGPIDLASRGVTLPASRFTGEAASTDVPDQIDLSEVLAELAATPAPARSRGKIIPATRVEHGHSATQDSLYWYLWRAGKSVKGSRSHFVQAGYGQIQAGIGVDRSNVQDAIRELQKKLAIRVVKANTVGSATIYEIFCCDDILAKRKEAKLVWARAYGKRRVDLLTETEAASEASRTAAGITPTDVTPIGLGTGVVQPTDRAGSVSLRSKESTSVAPGPPHYKFCNEK
jgi:hypothetical protein